MEKRRQIITGRGGGRGGEDGQKKVGGTNRAREGGRWEEMEGYVVVISMLSFRCNVAPNPLVGGEVGVRGWKCWV